MGPNPAFLTLPPSLQNFQGSQRALPGPARVTLAMREQRAWGVLVILRVCSYNDTHLEAQNAHTLTLHLTLK